MSKRKIITLTLKKRLISRLKKSQKKLQKNHPHAVNFLKNKEISIDNIRDHAKKFVASGIVAGSLMLATPTFSTIMTTEVVKHADLSQFERETLFSQELMNHLPVKGYKLSSDQEELVSRLIKSYWNVDAYPIFENKRLNHSYGLMGGEQHLPRFPGDSVFLHDELQKAEITPARGAWGYMARSEKDLTPDIIMKEKYYVAVQTLYLPDWNSNWVTLKEWYKFRKVIVINPKNGKTIIADIADAGPANWTGKHFGGSPELMQYLDLYKGMMKGEVLLYFVDDPDDTVPLGPVKYN